MSRMPVKLPSCGMFVGVAVYPMSADNLLSTLYGHQSWTPQDSSPIEMLERLIKDNQGNMAQVWGYARGYAPAMLAEWLYALDEIGVQVPRPDWSSMRHLTPEDCPELKKHADRRGAGHLRFIRAAAEKGVYTMLLYTDSEPQWSKRFAESGDFYLGYNFGERFTFRLDESSLKGKKLKDVTLQMLADDLVGRVRAHVDERHKTGWGNVFATSGNFYIDYEIAAGADIPMVEDFAFCNLNLSSAISRGLCRQHNLPLWASHLAHEHYSWIPYSNEHKFDLLKAALYLKYMSGSKMIVNESGHAFVEASLCEDSPKFEFPRVKLPANRERKTPVEYAPFLEEARRYYDRVNYDAPWCRRYRKVISDFYDFVKAAGAPQGQPETTVALAKGHLDLCEHRYMPNYAIGGAYALADSNPQWFEGAPERGWEIARQVFFPLRPVLGPHPNHFLSGTPHGMADVVSFAMGGLNAEFLIGAYRAVLFSGWNTASEAQYEVLKQYVNGGGTLFLAIPHLSTNMRRNYSSYTVDELVRGGDVSDLCGVRIKGRGPRFYWATAPDGSEELGFRFPRRFGIMATPRGDIEITDPAIETLVVDDEEAYPLLLRRRCGKGVVYFLNSWAYPGALDADHGPGASLDSRGLIGAIYQHIAARARGRVWITDDRAMPRSECDYIAYSYFPQAGMIYMLNVDFDRSHECFLHHFGVADRVELAPFEFKAIASVKSAAL